MTINRKVLLDALKLAMPGIDAGNAVLQGADAFVFYKGGLFTYNDSIAVVVPIESTGLVSDDVEGAVHAKQFYNVISKFTSDEISFEVTEKGSWILRCGKAKAEINLLDFDYRKRLEGVSPKNDAWIDVPEDFLEALLSCRMSGNKTPLSGLYVKDDVVVSTDGMQINMYNLSAQLPKFWISDASLGELLKLKEFKKMQLDGVWVHFKTEHDVVLSIKTLNDEKFPYEKIANLMDTAKPKDTDLHATFPKEVFAAVDRASDFSLESSDTQVVRLELSNDGIEVSAERNSGNYHETVSWDKPLNIDMEPMTIYVSPVMMNAMSLHSLDFYLMKLVGKGGAVLPRLMFVTEKSRHLMTTFSK